MDELKDIEGFKNCIVDLDNIIIKKGKHHYYQDFIRLVFGLDMKNLSSYKFEKKEFQKLKKLLKGTFHERFLK